MLDSLTLFFLLINMCMTALVRLRIPIVAYTFTLQEDRCIQMLIFLIQARLIGARTWCLANPPKPVDANDGQGHDCEPIHITDRHMPQTQGGAKRDTASICPAASVVAAAAAAEPLAVAGCSARGGSHDADRTNANKKRSQPFRTPKIKHNLPPRA